MPNPNHVTELTNMSDNLVEKVTEETELTATVETEQQEAAAADLAEGLTQEPAEEAIETIGLDDLVGETQTQDEAEGEHQKQLNNAYAKGRVTRKRLKHLEEQIDQGNIPDALAFKPQEPKSAPQLSDFQSRLYDDFESEPAIMIEAYKEALRDYEASHQSVSQQEEAHNAQVKQHLAMQTQAEESYLENVERYQKFVPSLDEGLKKAETLLGEDDFNAIRDVAGDNAPLVLGIIGTNKEAQNGLQAAYQASMSQGNQIELIKYITRLGDDASKRLPQKTYSKAPSDTPLSGGTSKTIDYDAEIQKVKNDPKLRGMPAVNKLKELRAAKAALHK